MDRALQIGAGLFCAMFTVSAIRWIAAPADAAAELQMQLLSGAARSTQIGDIGAFFIGLAILIGVGLWRRNAHWLRAAALLLAAAAAMRTLAWAVHDAPFATTFVLVEAIGAVLLFAAGARLALPVSKKVSI